jgi:hypothetical protein
MTIQTGRSKGANWRLLGVFLLLCFGCGENYAQNSVTATYNISNARAEWNASAVQSRLENVSSVNLNTTSSVAVLVERCPQGSYSLVNSQTCVSCPQGKYSVTPLASTADACVSCEAGKYSNRTGASSDATCTACPFHTYFGGTGGGNISVCQNCPVNSWSYEASKLREACVCLPGYSGPNGKRFPFRFASRGARISV